MLVVDSSSKFLRVALDRFGDEERVAFRLWRWLGEKLLELLEEVIGPEPAGSKAMTRLRPPTRSTS
jgi:hypothetical protein